MNMSQYKYKNVSYFWFHIVEIIAGERIVF